VANKLAKIRQRLVGAVDWILYTVLSEKQKNKLSNMFSDKQKENIRKLTQFGKKHQQKLHIKNLKDHLYSLGFTEEALSDLHREYNDSKDSFVKRLIAWELALWHANHYTKDHAKKALDYLEKAEVGEKDAQKLQRIAIIRAESLAHLGEVEKAKASLQEQISIQAHPDLYLGLANLETRLEMRFEQINKAFTMYQLEHITLSDFSVVDYDSLQMQTLPKRVDSNTGKISVILPAFRAEEGLHVAIESILTQSWRNLELLIVDDCSPDKTYEIAKQYEAKDDRVRVFQTSINSGPYIARNIGLQVATGEFVTINDADDWSHARKLELQVKHLMQNADVIANTSEHARLTEDLMLYRRGTPGRYIFPNMSSIMFRREPILNTIGYWDSVRFAADGEFKRRLIRAFGKKSYVDLRTGPLSLPRQSLSSLTSNSAFGYNGFFMGVRKEYVESLEYFHRNTNEWKYSYPQTVRPFPVPEPMWPIREEKQEQMRQFDLVIATDLRDTNELPRIKKIIEKALKSNEINRIGIIQLYTYNLQIPLHVSEEIRPYIDGVHVQMLVYGEKINTNEIIYIGHEPMLYKQTYIPSVRAEQVSLIVFQMDNSVERSLNAIQLLHQKEPSIIPLDKSVRDKMRDKQWIISDENWCV